MGGSGRTVTQKDDGTSMKIWQAEMARQSELQKQQQQMMMQQIQEQRAAEARQKAKEENARIEQQRMLEQKEKDRIASEKATSQNQAAAQQATGLLPSMPAVAAPRLIPDAAKEAPGLSPFKDVLKAGNSFYQAPGMKIGGM